MKLYQKIAFMMAAIAICHLVSGFPVVRIENSGYGEAMKTIPTGKSIKPDSSLEKSVERGGYRGAYSPGVVLEARVKQKESSQETLVHSLSEDDSTVTMSNAVLRQQSNSQIKGSDVTDTNISFSPDVSLGGR